MSKKSNTKLPSFNLSFGQKEALNEVKEEIQHNHVESSQLLPLQTIKQTEEIPEQRFSFKVPTPHVCVSSASSPYIAMNWYGSPQTQCTFSTTINGIPQAQGLITSLSPLAISPRMDTFGDFERLCAGRQFTFGESPVNYCIPYFNNSPSFARSLINQQPPSK